MKINTKVVFEWNPKSKQYEEIYCDSYEHDGEVAQCYGGMSGGMSGVPSGGGGGGDMFYGRQKGFDWGDLFGEKSIFNFGKGEAGAGGGSSWMQSPWAAGAAGLFGGIAGYGQAKSQQKGLGVAIGELNPLKDVYMGEHERYKGRAESYLPGGQYSRYMAGQVMSAGTEAAGQESERLIASGINSPSMMRAMGIQSRRQTQAAMPGMELQLSQMALPYEQMGQQSLTQYGGVVEQLASLKGAKAAIDPWSQALSGALSGAASMFSFV